MLALEYLEQLGLKVNTAASATEALDKLRLIPGGVRHMVIDMGLPDRSSGAVVRESPRAASTALPIVIATGQSGGDLRNLLTQGPGSYPCTIALQFR